MKKEQIGEYLRTLLIQNQVSESTTAADCIKELNFRLDVEGVEDEKEERRLERIRDFFKSTPADTTVETMSEWI